MISVSVWLDPETEFQVGDDGGWLQMKWELQDRTTSDLIVMIRDGDAAEVAQSVADIDRLIAAFEEAKQLLRKPEA